MQIDSFARSYIKQCKFTFEKHREALQFINKHKLWNGFDRYGWLAKMMLLIAVLIGCYFISIVYNWWQNTGANTSNLYSAASSVGTLFQDIFTEGFKPLYMGGMKYFVLILAEVLVFHFSRRTLEILTGKAGQSKFEEFVIAQKRMIKVAIFSFFVEVIGKMAFGIFFNFYGFLEFSRPVLVLVLQCFLLGFAVVDNYNEQFGLPIKASFRYTLKYSGIALVTGAILYLLLFIPLIGALAGPIIAAVAATIAMHEFTGGELANLTDIVPDYAPPSGS